MVSIRSRSYLSTNQVPDIAGKKESIVDVLCRDRNGVQTIVEMQVRRPDVLKNVLNTMQQKYIQAKLTKVINTKTSKKPTSLP